MGIEAVLSLLDSFHRVINVLDLHFGDFVTLLLFTVGNVELIVFHYYLVILTVYLIVHCKQLFKLIIVVYDFIFQELARNFLRNGGEAGIQIVVRAVRSDL